MSGPDGFDAPKKDDRPIDPVGAEVEDFIQRHESGNSPDLEEFISCLDPALRDEVRHECETYLAVLPALEGTRLPEIELQRLGQYRLLRRLGGGGMATVYLAEDERDARRVAVKVLHHHFTASLIQLDRFHSEASAVMSLEHPGIVPVVERGEEDGHHYLVLEYCPGGSVERELEAYRADEAYPVDPDSVLELRAENRIARAVKVAAQISHSLAYAHSRGVIHRDVKPGNLLLDKNGNARLSDFGLARVVDKNSITLEGELLGTLYYMSPEQALAQRVDVDGRTDVFSLGVVLYEMLTLRRPFDKANPHQLLYDISFTDPVAPRRLNPRIPADLETIVLMAMAKSPQDRYESALEMARDLERFARLEAIAARRIPLLRRAIRVAQRNRALSAVILAALVALAGAAAWLQFDAHRRVADDLATLREFLADPDRESLPPVKLFEHLQDVRRISSAYPANADCAEVVSAVNAVLELAAERLLESGNQKLKQSYASEPGTKLKDYRDESNQLFFEGKEEVRWAERLSPEGLRTPGDKLGMPRLSVTCKHPGARIYLQPMVWTAGRYGDVIDLGPTPIRKVAISPGYYRITVSSPEGFAELTRWIAHRGRDYNVFGTDGSGVALQPVKDVSDGMVPILENLEFITGVGGVAEESPLRKAEVRPFFIDRLEVTNAQYRAFVQETEHRAPPYWESGYREEWDLLPVVMITWLDARACAEWMGKRLPTSLEWERGARGTGGRVIPWMEMGPEIGREILDERFAQRVKAVSRIQYKPADESFPAGLVPVGSMTGDVSPDGLLDTFGNAMEWVDGVQLAVIRGEPFPAIPIRQAKGGCWTYHLIQSTLGNYTAMAADTNRMVPDCGFRCAKSASPIRDSATERND